MCHTQICSTSCSSSTACDYHLQTTALYQASKPHSELFSAVFLDHWKPCKLLSWKPIYFYKENCTQCLARTASLLSLQHKVGHLLNLQSCHTAPRILLFPSAAMVYITCLIHLLQPLKLRPCSWTRIFIPGSYSSSKAWQYMGTLKEKGCRFPQGMAFLSSDGFSSVGITPMFKASKKQRSPRKL